jgi:hypothetical protein
VSSCHSRRSQLQIPVMGVSLDGEYMYPPHGHSPKGSRYHLASMVVHRLRVASSESLNENRRENSS